jgi:hypothetical protein
MKRATFLAGILTVLIPTLLYSQNYVTTLAGQGSPGFLDGDTSEAMFNRPFGITIDPDGNLYLADAYNHRIRKIDTDGQVTTFAGTGQAGYEDGPASEARFNQPLNICFDAEGNMYVSDFINQRIRKISTDMEVTTIAGTGVPGFNDGPALEAQFNYPRGICADDTGNIYVGDSWNHRVRKISTDGLVTTWAGGGDTIGVQSVGGYVDASDTSARFYTPCELSIDQYNNIFVADAYNHRIRKVDPSRMVTTVAGSGGHGPDGGGYKDGPNDSAEFNVPTACHVMMDGRIFVGDGSNQRVRFIGIEEVTTFAGTGEAGFEDGVDSLATFDFPRGSVFDYETNRLYIVDFNNHAIRTIHIEDDITEIAELPLELSLAAYPNPFGQSATIAYQLSKPGTVDIEIYDLMGRGVSLISDEVVASGKHEFVWRSETYPPGVYFCRIKTGGSGKTIKIVKRH